MFKKFTMMMTLYCCSATMLESNLKIAIAAKDFHGGNSLVLIARDVNGLEQVAGYVSLQAGKTEFSLDEISCHDQTLSSIADEKTTVIADVKDDFSKKGDDVIYLYFEIDATINIVRALVITNNLFSDTPFNVIEFSTGSMSNDDEDFFGDCSFGDDELSQLNLTDIQTSSAELSYYDKMMLAAYAVWAIQSAQAKQTYKKFTQWLASYHAE
ncbi:hypothetical protein KBC04_04470 [Candidatus Babeliales bacterium]|nr:hypothetical protein [Candidatus Babeliales bacterium]MBP9844075.1 hypothetical protein [Candidatus Babeliales bacterium]